MLLKINRKLFFLLVLTVLFVLPFSAFGQIDFPDAPTGGQNIDIANNILIPILGNIIWPIAITLVIIFFIIAGFKFLTAQGKPEELQTARRFLIWAVGGVIVIILSFSIITIIQTTFNLF